MLLEFTGGTKVDNHNNVVLFGGHYICVGQGLYHQIYSEHIVYDSILMSLILKYLSDIYDTESTTSKF